MIILELFFMGNFILIKSYFHISIKTSLHTFCELKAVF